MPFLSLIHDDFYVSFLLPWLYLWPLFSVIALVCLIHQDSLVSFNYDDTFVSFIRDYSLLYFIHHDYVSNEAGRFRSDSMVTVLWGRYGIVLGVAFYNTIRPTLGRFDF